MLYLIIDKIFKNNFFFEQRKNIDNSQPQLRKGIGKIIQRKQGYIKISHGTKQKIETLISHEVKIQQDNNRLKKEINSKPESPEMNMLLAQVEEQLNKIATYTQSKFLKRQSNGNPEDIETEKYQSINRKEYQDGGFAREEGTQSDNAYNSLKNKRLKKQNYKIKQINYTAQQGQIYGRKCYQGWEHIKQQQKQTILK